jgi:hypothetical protein
MRGFAHSVFLGGLLAKYLPQAGRIGLLEAAGACGIKSSAAADSGLGPIHRGIKSSAAADSGTTSRSPSRFVDQTKQQPNQYDHRTSSESQ